MQFRFQTACHRAVWFLGCCRTKQGPWIQFQPRLQPGNPEPLLTLLTDSISIKLQTWLLCDHQPFHCPIFVECLGLDCKVEYNHANKDIKPESDNIYVQYKASDLNTTFQGWVPSVPVLYIGWTLPKQILQFQEPLPARKTKLTCSQRCKKTQQWILHFQVEEYVGEIPTKYKDLHGWANCIDRFIWIVKQTDKIHIVHGGASIGLAQLVRDNVESERIDSVQLVNNHVDIDTYRTVD